MGVPSFYRWLVNKYPKIVVEAIDKQRGRVSNDDVNVVEEEDTSLANPNGIEFDNLYLDMNGIIHPCFHPQDDNHQLAEPPTTFQQVFDSVCVYIDKLFRIVRPRKLLFMAIDGVAPRAKMNQQRSRRFQTAKNNEIAEVEEDKLRKEFEMEGKVLSPKQESEVSDSNIITPGTEFMHHLSIALKSYINDKLKNDAGWKDIKVVLSDASAPGEGEHKIMSFIRAQRGCPYYNPNTRHCLYGLDADLIMLALATHEVHFSILREDVLGEQRQPPKTQDISTGPMLAKSENSWLSTRPWFKQRVESKTSALVEKPYQFLHVWILREYLELEFGMIDSTPDKIKMDFERYIDDFVFMCFFAGNDFLPHMPTLEIHEGAVDLLMHVYKNEFKNLGGFLTDMQWVEDKKCRYVKLKRIEKFILLVGGYEDRIFKKRSEMRDRLIKRILAEHSDSKEEDHNNGGNKPIEDMASLQICESSVQDVKQNMKELKEKLQMCIREKSDQFKNGNFMVDKVRLGTPGFKERYYKEKFLAETKEDIELTRKSVVQKYTEGLCWVLVYYYSGVPSWTWFYPYHYGPFASDLKGLPQVKVKFQKGLPFKPFDQLMAVLPPRSAHALPEVYRELMTDEERSMIIDFYPTDFKVDADGKRHLWLAISKLPFIDEERLVTETRKLEVELTEIETTRNTSSVDHLFVKGTNKLATQVLSFYQKSHAAKHKEVVKETIDTSLSLGTSGVISTVCNEVLQAASTSETNFWEDPDGRGELVLCVFYELPNDWPLAPPRPLEGATFPDKILSKDDVGENELWHERQGNRPNSNRYQFEAKQRRANETENSASRSSLGNCVIQKDAGSGWSYGRGRANAAMTASSGTSSGRGGVVSYGVQSSRWDERRQPMGTSITGPNYYQNQPSFSSYTRRQQPPTNYNSYGRGKWEPMGSGGLKDSSHTVSRSNERSRPPYDGFTGGSTRQQAGYSSGMDTNSWTRSRSSSANIQLRPDAASLACPPMAAAQTNTRQTSSYNNCRQRGWFPESKD